MCWMMCRLAFLEVIKFKDSSIFSVYILIISPYIHILIPTNYFPQFCLVTVRINTGKAGVSLCLELARRDIHMKYELSKVSSEPIVFKFSSLCFKLHSSACERSEYYNLNCLRI